MAHHALGREAPWERGFDHRPPETPPGLTCAAPDFVGIGAQKAGTTWWFRLINEHPDVYHHATFYKERHFLSAVGADEDPSPALARDYAGWFPRPDGAIAGEWTPDYLMYYWLAPALATVAPEVKLLVLLRDPVERYRSGLAHQEAFGALSGDPKAVQEAFDRGLYAAQLEAWEKQFPPGQLLVLQYERCCEDPGGQLAATFRFLGLDDGFRPQALTASTGRSAHRPELTVYRRRLLCDLYSRDVTELVRRYPQIDLSYWPNFAG